MTENGNTVICNTPISALASPTASSLLKNACLETLTSTFPGKAASFYARYTVIQQSARWRVSNLVSRGLAASLLILVGCGRLYVVPSPNMEPTIHTNDIVALNQSAYRRAKPQRWDVIAFSSPTDSALHVSRIWGLPGETINLTNGLVQINGTNVSLPSDLLSVIKFGDLFPSNAVAMIKFPYQVSNTGFFVMGDNLRNSYDSRFWGDLASNRIAGRVSIIK